MARERRDLHECGHVRWPPRLHQVVSPQSIRSFPLNRTRARSAAAGRCTGARRVLDGRPAVPVSGHIRLGVPSSFLSVACSADLGAPLRFGQPHTSLFHVKPRTQGPLVVRGTERDQCHAEHSAPPSAMPAKCDAGQAQCSAKRTALGSSVPAKQTALGSRVLAKQSALACSVSCPRAVLWQAESKRAPGLLRPASRVVAAVLWGWAMGLGYGAGTAGGMSATAQCCCAA